jgi:hypothetical protein
MVAAFTITTCIAFSRCTSTAFGRLAFGRNRRTLGGCSLGSSCYLVFVSPFGVLSFISLLLPTPVAEGQSLVNIIVPCSRFGRFDRLCTTRVGA